jgi:hypothetical protein
MLTLSQLKNKMLQNQESYKMVEIGVGVRSFIKDCFASSNLFSLKEISRETNRSNTFAHNVQKVFRCIPDLILFVDDNIIMLAKANKALSMEFGERHQKFQL